MKKYALRTPPPAEADQAMAPYSEIARQMLFARGIETPAGAEKFLNPSYDNHLHDPFLILGMEKAVERILKAIKDKEIIAIWSDYDHDGIPGGVILHDFFKKIGYDNFTNYIPHRGLEGYGLNSKGVKKLAEAGVKLIITVDVGITDVAPTETANNLGVDVIITDHHLPNGKLPPALAILNHKQANDTYPEKILCGAGMAFKLVQGLTVRGRAEWQLAPGWEKWLLDLVGISTIGDMVPLVGENRALAHYGLKVLRKTRRPGLLKLFRKAGIQREHLNEDDVAFSITPRINAASRMDDPYIAFELLSSADDGRTESLAGELHQLNDRRKGVVASMVKEMKHVLNKREALSPVIVMGNPDWRPALLGVAAMNLVEEHNRPVFLWGREGEEKLKGSCRSDGSVNVVTLMQTVQSGVFLEYGGHANSGGFSVSFSEVHYLERHIIEAYEKVRQEEPKEEVLIDRKLSLDEVNWPLWDILSSFAPFGVSNPKPLFLFENVAPEKTRRFGKKEEHLEITFRKTNGDFVRAIEFFSTRPEFQGPTLGQLLRSDLKKLNLVATLEKSTFGRYPELRLRIVDLL